MARLGWMTLFAIAMGFLESAVVVYLRELYYPSGFAFPIVPMPGHIALTEAIREAATILMLFSVGWIAGTNLRQRFAWFIYCFAVWDIFYYVFLKLLVHWPESLLTWDILFLIPVMWTGPVIAPVVVSATMILMAGVLLRCGSGICKPVISWHTSLLIVAGAFLVFVSFIWDYSFFVISRFSFSALFQADSTRQALEMYMPSRFNWILFLAGEGAILTGIYRLFRDLQSAVIESRSP